MVLKNPDSRAIFHRPPREFPPQPPSDPIRIAAPPAVAEHHYGGVLMILLPVLGSLSMVGFAIAYHNKLFLYMAIGMAFLALLSGAGTQLSQRRNGKRTAGRKRKRYEAHLAAQDRRLAHVANLQREAAERRHPDPRRLTDTVARREHLWERRPGDADFLSARVGLAPVAHAGRSRVELGNDPLAEHEEQILAQAHALAHRWSTVAVAVSLPAAAVLAVVGESERARACVSLDGRAVRDRGVDPQRLRELTAMSLWTTPATSRRGYLALEVH